MASQNIARLGVVLGIDTAEFTAGIEKAISEQKKLKSAITRESNAAAKEIVALKYATDDFTKSLTKAEQVQREFVVGGKYANATKDLQNQLLAQARAYDAAALSAKKLREEQLKGALGGAGGLTAQQKAALGYQTTDIITGLAGGQNPLLVLIQQGGQLRDQFGGFGNVLKALQTVITPVRLALGGMAAVVGILGYAFYKGAKEAGDFRDSLILTNNYSGLTTKSLGDLAGTLSTKLNTSIGNSKEALYALSASGKFTKESIGAVSEAVLNFAKLTGKSGKEAADELMSAFDGTAASAKSLNDKYHFLSIAQYKQIELLEQQGKKQQAIALQATAFNQMVEGHKRDVGDLARAWEGATNWFSKYWDKLKGLGDIGTTDDLIKRTKNQIETIKASIASTGGEGTKAQRDALEIALINLKYYESEKAKVEQQAADNAKKQQEVDAYQKAGGLKKEQELTYEYRKAAYEEQIKAAMVGANEETRIKLEAAQKVYEEILKTEKNLLSDGTYFAEKEYRNRDQKISAILKDAEQKRAEQSRLEEKKYVDRQAAEKLTIDTEKEKLELYQRNIFLSDTDYQIALDRLKTEKEIAEIARNTKLSPQRQEELIAEERALQTRREEVAKLGESLKVLKDINASVFKNMTDALTNFIMTGKLNFKNFAATVITELIRIQAAAIAAQASRGIMGAIGSVVGNMFGNMGTAMQYNTNIGSQQTAMLAAQDAAFKAGGGDVMSGSPYIVGDQGPELFIPRNAGTIVPNGNLAGAMGNTVINNYNIDAIDVKSFEERVLGSSNAVWAANQYANKSLAVGRGRT